MTRDLLKAIELALGNQWDQAHRIVQQFDDDPTAAWIHAVLHKIEGDLGNSRYWYRRAGKGDCTDLQPMAELQCIREALPP